MSDAKNDASKAPRDHDESSTEREKRRRERRAALQATRHAPIPADLAMQRRQADEQAAGLFRESMRQLFAEDAPKEEAEVIPPEAGPNPDPKKNS